MDRLLMVAMTEIEEFSRRIGQEFDAERIILFASFASDQAGEYSDMDMIVIEPIPCGEREWETEHGRPILDIA